MSEQITAAVVLAHQGGWDEMLMVAVPILVFVFALRLANKRAEEQARKGDTSRLDGEPDRDGTTGS